MRSARLVILAQVLAWLVSCAEPDELTSGGMTPEGGAAAGTDGSAASSAAGGVGASGGSLAPDASAGASGAAVAGGAGTAGSPAGGNAGTSGGGMSGGGTSGGGTSGGGTSGGGTSGRHVGGGRAGAGGGGASGAGGGGGCGGADTDGDGLQDCDEDGDGNSWTDRTIFNGMKVRQSDQCNGITSCTNNDTRAKIDACMTQNPIREEKDQYAGWDFSNQPDDLCTAGYGFRPNWTVCDSRWQAEWRGFINFASAGNHCFAVVGNTREQCGALLFNTETTPLQTGQAAKCFDVAAGVYPISWHYTMDNSVANDNSLRIAYCFGGSVLCVPTSVLSSRLLRTTYP